MDGSPRGAVDGREGDVDADAVGRRAVASGLVESAHMVGVVQATQDETVGEFGTLHRFDDDACPAVLGGKSRACLAPTRSFARRVLARRLDRAFGPEEAGDELEVFVELLADIAIDAADDVVRPILRYLAHPIGIGQKL